MRALLWLLVVSEHGREQGEAGSLGILMKALGSPIRALLILKLKYYSISHVTLFVTLQTVACQASLSMEFSRQEYWSGLPFPSPEDLPDPGIKPGYPIELQADSLPSELPNSLQRPHLLRPLHWDMGFQYKDLRGTQTFNP